MSFLVYYLYKCLLLADLDVPAIRIGRWLGMAVDHGGCSAVRLEDFDSSTSGTEDG